MNPAFHPCLIGHRPGIPAGFPGIPTRHGTARAALPGPGVARALAAAWIALVGIRGLAAPAETPKPPPISDRPPLPAVLEVGRLPDADLLLLRNGERKEGALLNESFHLRGPAGDLVFPADRVAGIGLSDNPEGVDTLVTVTPDRFSGYLNERSFRLRLKESGEVWEVRPERVLKVLRHREPGESARPVSGFLVRLKNGDFFAAQMADPRFTIDETGASLQWARDGIASVSFPRRHETDARLRLANGQELKGRPITDDLEFTVEPGIGLRIFAGRVEEIRGLGPLPAELGDRIGLRSVGAPDPAFPAAAPNPEVVPMAGMVWIPPGEFTMGSPPEEKDRDLDEGPQTRVVMAEGFWVGRNEVTQAEYVAVRGDNPSRYLGEARHPVERVNWQEAMDYCSDLTVRERAAGHLPDGYAYRLPTEAEWEYVCRAGTSTRFSHGDDPAFTLVREFAWINGNSDSTTHPVGTRKANPWGLHDLHGNVCEWCLDDWHGSHPGGTVTNTPVLPSGTLRIARGGSWLYEPRFARSANRDSYGMLNRCSDVGFRIVLAGSPSNTAPRTDIR